MASPATLVIRRAAPTTQEIDTVARVITEAVMDLEPSRWLIPDAVTRGWLLPSYFRLPVEHALYHGRVDVAIDPTHPDEIVGTAVWWRSGVEIADHDTKAAGVIPAGTHVLERFRVFDQLMNGQRPTTPHMNLALVGVVPERQRRGIGRRLVEFRLRELDSHSEAAYTVAATPEASSLLRDLGFEDQAAYQLPNGGPHMFPMRRPRSSDREGQQ